MNKTILSIFLTLLLAVDGSETPPCGMPPDILSVKNFSEITCKYE